MRSAPLFQLVCVLVAAAACVERGDVLRPEANEGVDSEQGGAGSGGSGGSGGSAAFGGSAGSPAPSAVLSSISLGTAHGTALSANRLFAWGDNEAGELGQGDTLERHVPTEVASEVRFSTVAGGGNSSARGYTCAIDEVGAVYCWGANTRGQLGQGDRSERHSPSRVPLKQVAARSITADFEHVCALLADASLYCWGRNQEGELGQSDSGTPGDDDTARDALEPVEVPGADWSFVDTGDGHTCGIRFDGTLWCWGRNTGHQLGPTNEGQVRHPIQVGSDTDWLRVDSGQQHSLALKQDHSLWGWGLNVASGSGEGNPLGLDVEEVATPTRLGSAADWVTISTRVFHSCAVNRADELWCWGRGIEGQLGTGDLALRSVPTLVATCITDVDVSWFMTCAVTRGGRLGCTGANDHGELGTGDTERVSSFTDVTPPTL